MTLTIDAWFERRRREIDQPVRLYALVDGLLYESVEHASPLTRGADKIALFDGTPDVALADAGPWLIDHGASSPGTRHTLAALARKEAGMSWLVSAYRPVALADDLRERLNVRLPDGRVMLLRFYDARVMRHLATLLDFSQRLQFFMPTFDWLLQFDGEIARIHPHAS